MAGCDENIMGVPGYRLSQVIVYVWTRYLGRSGRELSEWLNISTQAVYTAATRIEKNRELSDDLLERLCQ